MEDEEDEEDEEEQHEEQQLGHEGCSTHDEEDAPPQHAPSSYFDDQGGRVVRGSSFSASLEVRTSSSSAFLSLVLIVCMDACVLAPALLPPPHPH